MTVKELKKRIRGYNDNEVNIRIKMYDEWGYEHHIDCSVENDVECSEQGGFFEAHIVLVPDEDQIFEMNRTRVGFNNYIEQ